MTYVLLLSEAELRSLQDHFRATEKMSPDLFMVAEQVAITLNGIELDREEEDAQADGLKRRRVAS